MSFQESLREYRAELERRREELSPLYPMAFVEIPQTELDLDGWKRWLFRLECQWRREIDCNYIPDQIFNEASGIGGTFGRFSFSHCKLYRSDGTEGTGRGEDLRSRRGYTITDHDDGIVDSHKVQVIADNLGDFLRVQKIKHRRFNFHRKGLTPVLVYQTI